MVFEKTFHSPNLAAAYIQGLEDGDNDGSTHVDDVELWTIESQSLGLEAWVVIVSQISLCDDNLFDRTGWGKKELEKVWPNSGFKSWLNYVRSFIKDPHPNF